MKQLHHQGASLAELAKKLGWSKKRVRDLIELADLPDDLKRGYLEGKLGRKKVQAVARARVKAARKTEVIFAATEVAMTSQPSPLPAMTAEQRQKMVEEHARRIMEWSIRLVWVMASEVRCSAR